MLPAAAARIETRAVPGIVGVIGEQWSWRNIFSSHYGHPVQGTVGEVRDRLGVVSRSSSLGSFEFAKGGKSLKSLRSGASR